jgi:nucleoside-diphosphate-sugar epimerase
MGFTLITGASGFLGSHVLTELKTRDFEILTLGRNKKSKIICDISKEIPKIDKNLELDLVIHIAGKAHSKENDSDYYNVNVLGTQNLILGLENSIKPKKFVFISSVSVYGQEKGENITENTELHFENKYSQSKIQAEKIIKEWCLINNITLTILRLPLIVGKNPPGNLGSMIKAIKNNYYFNVNGGEAKKSMVLAIDVAKFIPKISTKGGTFNLTDGDHPSFYDLSYAIGKKKQLNLPKNIVKLIALFGDIIGDKFPINTKKLIKLTENLTFDDSNARNHGWKPELILEYLKKNDL